MPTPFILPLVLLVLSLVACGGGSDTAETPQATITVPGAPTIDSVSAGDASATIEFSAPASNGGATISGYEATCISDANSQMNRGPIARLQ
jgi:hypothetical protein